MRVDLERTVQVVQAATDFDWTWTVDDLPGFAEQVGWQVGNLGQRSPTMTTNLEVNRVDAMAYVEDTRAMPRPLNSVEFYFSDVVRDDPTVKPFLDSAFDELVQRVFVLVGQCPTGWWINPSRGLRWDLPNLVLQISVRDHSGDVELISPVYKAWRDGIDKRIEEEANPDQERVWRFD
ncbi:hypothetical protein DFR70_13229 [Nocardia tenerifensis]|uniref:Uncharacterized protein n=1 Tax=Nocardia tenerifensis TaxID=228006 RepID=A0A318JRW5_9NOCA|nr:DUF6301 family protein [Nocardia tenerifensis]PXX52644.1 hypothetical protein DFR70_13229 [Nocardia tenerifensis]